MLYMRARMLINLCVYHTRIVKNAVMYIHRFFVLIFICVRRILCAITNIGTRIFFFLVHFDDESIHLDVTFYFLLFTKAIIY